ncbi:MULTISPECIES: PACE efflux transporter [unclassified Shewanella]|uniref:PACE efflux transporter n=1 Tax=unclassified Shewanella TaxID=196818 RepID=UPI0005A1B6CB|nr:MULTISPECIES: PACE efflux transporter [unclassified Shewanella]KIO36229.1 membrane protein [Shewanella sp. cp20]MCG9720610.1 PACE efflux transporter [Shewanella sp. Isolate7]
MSTAERILHSVLFEIFALVLVVPIAIWFTGHGVAEMAAVGIGLSLYTVTWNYFYNLQFDKYFGEDRTRRTLKLRVLHALGFEGGLVFVTVPVVAWFLAISIWQALMLEAVFLVVFFFYAIIFNWLFDWARSKFYGQRVGS